MEDIASAENLRRAGARPGEVESLALSLLDGTYRPGRLRPHPIARAGDPLEEPRILRIPAHVDRVVQKAFLLKLAPLWEPTFHESSFGFRRGSSVFAAVMKARDYVRQDRTHVLSVDIKDFFDSIPRDRLLEKVLGVALDPRVAAQLRRMIAASGEGERGIPQGAPLSPLLSNLYLNELDHDLGRSLHVIRYADDIRVFARSPRSAQRNLARIEAALDRIGLEVNDAKSGVSHASDVDILGFTVWPKLTCSARSLAKVSDRLSHAASKTESRKYLRRLNRYLSQFSLRVCPSLPYPSLHVSERHVDAGQGPPLG